MTFTVRFAPEAVDQLRSFRRYLTGVATEQVVTAYLDRLVAHCEGLGEFPHRGSPRFDLRPGLRTVSYRRRIVIAYSVDDPRSLVTIIGVFAGGQDMESMLEAGDELP